MNAKQFSKFAYQSKLIPVYATVDDVNSTFRNILRYYRTNDSKQHQGTKALYIDYEMYIRALIRLGLIGKEGLEQTVPAEEVARITEEVTQQMKDEFISTSNKPFNDKDFASWMQDQDTHGSGLKQRILTIKRRTRGRGVRANSVTKVSFVDVDINTFTATDMQDLFTFIGIGSNGDIDEKLLDEKQNLAGLDAADAKQWFQPQQSAKNNSKVKTLGLSMK